METQLPQLFPRRQFQRDHRLRPSNPAGAFGAWGRQRVCQTIQPAYNAVSAVYDAVQQRSAAMGVGSYGTARTDWNISASASSGQSGAVGDMGGVTSERITAGHDSVYYSQAEIDSFMSGYRAQNPVAVSPAAAPEAPYDPHYVSNAPRPSTQSGNASAERSGSAGAGEVTGTSAAASTQASGGTAANGVGTRQSTSSSSVSRSGSAGAGSTSSGALIVSSESVDRERARQVELEAVRLQSIRDREAADARTAAGMAAIDAAQEAEAQRRHAELCRLQPAYCDPNAKAVPR